MKQVSRKKNDVGTSSTRDGTVAEIFLKALLKSASLIAHGSLQPPTNNVGRSMAATPASVIYRVKTMGLIA